MEHTSMSDLNIALLYAAVVSASFMLAWAAAIG